MDFTHFDEKGNAIMVDVSSKDTTQRTCILLMVKFMLVKKYLRKLKIIK